MSLSILVPSSFRLEAPAVGDMAMRNVHVLAMWSEGTEEVLMPDSSHVGEFSGESEWRKARPSGIFGWLKERYRRDICCWAEREEEGSVLMHIVHARIHGVYPARPKRRTWL